jgi:hypothetical protein
MEEAESEVTRLTIRPPPQPEEAGEDKETYRHYYHIMVQYLKAVFIYISIFSAILILSILVWGIFVLLIVALINGFDPILNTVL